MFRDYYPKTPLCKKEFPFSVPEIMATVFTAISQAPDHNAAVTPNAIRVAEAASFNRSKVLTQSKVLRRDFSDRRDVAVQQQRNLSTISDLGQFEL